MTGRAFILALVALAIAAPAASAATRHHHHRTPPPFRVTRSYVRSSDHVRHQVTMVAYRPGHRMRFRVAASARHVLHTPPGWGNRTGAYAVLNADTWAWTTGIPTGVTLANGHRIVWPTLNREIWNRPAVGFYSSGGVVFGANQARERGAANIVGQVAYLLRGGHVLPHSSYVWAHPAQRDCGARHTDGAGGCWRSCVARWPNGRVGLVEVAFASMHQAATVLHRLGVQDASTGDSGGSSILAWRHRRSAPWSQAGVNHALGRSYLRAVPDSIVMVPRR